jgi:hypothetical protein
MIAGEGVVTVEHLGQHGHGLVVGDVGVELEAGAAEEQLGPLHAPPVRRPLPPPCLSGGGHRPPVPGPVSAIGSAAPAQPAASAARQVAVQYMPAIR